MIPAHLEPSDHPSKDDHNEAESLLPLLCCLGEKPGTVDRMLLSAAVPAEKLGRHLLAVSLRMAMFGDAPMNVTFADAGRGSWLADRPRTVADLRAKYRHLVWSNPDGALDDVYVYAALTGGEFHQLLDFACVLGLERLHIPRGSRGGTPPQAAFRR